MPLCAYGQTLYPSKPIRIIVPLAAGGPSDLLARTLGQKFTETWSQPVVIDNRTGANGVVGCEIAAKSPPDGYTLLMGTNGTHGINASLFSKLPYDTVNDFAPIARIGIAPYVLVAHPSLPVRSVAELIALARARPRADQYCLRRQRIASRVGIVQKHGGHRLAARAV
jgi:tripartite-type tricarboxylate transporter receptor subunit TctC